jgi:hypothetical protein
MGTSEPGGYAEHILGINEVICVIVCHKKYDKM